MPKSLKGAKLGLQRSATPKRVRALVAKYQSKIRGMEKQARPDSKDASVKMIANVAKRFKQAVKNDKDKG